MKNFTNKDLDWARAQMQRIVQYALDPVEQVVFFLEERQRIDAAVQESLRNPPKEK